MQQTRDAKGRWMQSVLAADTLTGDKVVNRQKEDLGTIEHLMIDVKKGRLAYAVLSFGGFLGMGDKLFAIPWGALAVDTSEEQFILDIDRKVLEGAPGFDKAHWPNMADRAWVKNSAPITAPSPIGPKSLDWVIGKVEKAVRVGTP